VEPDGREFFYHETKPGDPHLVAAITTAPAPAVTGRKRLFAAALRRASW
jgi:hypothetical protein